MKDLPNDELPSNSNVNEAGSAANEKEATSEVDRREYLKLAGAGAALLGGIGLGSSTVTATTDGGPPNQDNWELTFEDDFDGSSIDTSNWGIGWGWGNGSPGSKTTWAQERHVNVRNSNLVLTASKEDWESDGTLYAGGVNSKNKVTVEPPVYFEARMKMIPGVGWQNAFWSKPNTEAWPPEIDVVEFLQSSPDHRDQTSHNLHYSASGEPGDSSTHDTVHGSYHGYGSNELPGETFHVYGFEWRQDVVRHYVDGQVVEETTDPDVVSAFNNGGAQYLMLSLNLDNVGTTDKSVSWDGKELLCDWVRVWNPTGESGSGDTTDETTTHYMWARSADGTPTSFEFEASGGNIRLDSSGYEADYWIADDGMTAGGTTEKTSSLPGLFYDGEIASFSYDGSLELYIDDEPVDPDSLTNESTSSESTGLENTITIDGSNYSEQASYSFSVSDSIEATDMVNDDDTLSGQTAEGQVQGEIDEYTFDGDITALSLYGDADVYVNGTKVKLLRINRSPDSSGWVRYIVETTGRLMKATVDGGAANSSDRINGGKARGKVYGGADAYWLFEGNVVDVSTFGGDVVTDFDGERVDFTD